MLLLVTEANLFSTRSPGTTIQTGSTTGRDGCVVRPTIHPQATFQNGEDNLPAPFLEILAYTLSSLHLFFSSPLLDHFSSNIRLLDHSGTTNLSNVAG